MRRILLNLGVGLGMLTFGTTAYAQHGHGGHGGGHGGGHPGMHAPAMPMHHGNMHVPNHAGPHPISSPRPARIAPHPSHPQGPRGALPVRPTNRPSSGRTPIASARPATGRVPSNHRPATMPSSRRPASASASRPNPMPSSRRPANLQANHTVGKGAAHTQRVPNNQHKGSLSTVKRDLTSQDNNTLITGLPGLPSPLAQAGVKQALAGKPMTAAEVNAVKSMIGNTAMPAPMQAALASALQTDQQIKRQLATNNAINGLATGTTLDGIGGLVGTVGGLGSSAGNGGILGGLSGNGGSSGGSGGSGGGYPSGGDGDVGSYASGGDSGDYSPVVASGPIGGAISPAPAYASGVETAPAEEDEGGVLLQAVEAGAAADVAGLRAGDVILSFGELRTRTFEELQNAVQQAGGPVKVVFINGENGQTEYLTVEPTDGRIGVTCE